MKPNTDTSLPTGQAGFVSMTEGAKPKKSTTMFEMDDTNRSYESCGDRYIKPFKDFLATLGYEIVFKYPDSPILGDKILIDDIEFKIYAESASYWAEQAFTRKSGPRKAENRYVALQLPSGNAFVVKVYINKEMETQKIKAKIDAAIQASKDRDAELKRLEVEREANTVLVGNHYFADPKVRGFTKTLGIQQGKISFQFQGRFSLEIMADGSFHQAGYRPDEMNTHDDVMKFATVIGEYTREFNQVVGKIMSTAPLSPEIVAWAQDQHHQYFYAETMSTERVVKERSLA